MFSIGNCNSSSPNDHKLSVTNGRRLTSVIAWFTSERVSSLWKVYRKYDILLLTSNSMEESRESLNSIDQWLKECSRKGKFVDESAFILEDDDYGLNFKSELKNVVFRAKASPEALLKGYDICLAKHVQPSGGILYAVVKSAGGNVITRMDKVREPSRTIFIACEEDIVEAMLAAKKGVWIYSSDWLKNCLMRQELDLHSL